MVITDRMWRDLCAAIERPELTDDARFKTPRLRMEHHQELGEILAAFCARFDKHEAMRRLAGSGVPASAVFDTLDLFQNPHLEARDFYKQVKHPELGELTLLGSPVRMSDSEVEIEAPPVLGQHTLEVLKSELGLAREQLTALEQDGVIAPAAQRSRSDSK